MKTTILILIIVSIIILLIGFNSKANSKTESQKYEMIYKKGDFEIRFYPVATMASVSMKGDYDNMRNSGFRVLAGYIFGDNEQNTKIAMTSPVRMSSNEVVNTMSFVMPSEMELKSLPDPGNSEIRLHQSEPKYAASIRYGGYTNTNEINVQKAKLIEILTELKIEYDDNFEYLGYNPPYQMVKRRNEVLVELNNFEPKQFQKILAELE